MAKLEYRDLDYSQLREILPPHELADQPAPKELNPGDVHVGVAGMGLVSPLGIGVEKSWNSLINGKHGFIQINPKDLPVFEHYQKVIKTGIAAVVPNFREREEELLIDTHVIPDVTLRDLAQVHRMELVAAHEALRSIKKSDGTDAEFIQLVEETTDEGSSYHWRVNPKYGDSTRIAHIGASGVGGSAEGVVAAQARLDERDRNGNDKKKLPFGNHIFQALPGRVGSVVPLAFEGINGPWKEESNECSSGNLGLRDGMDLIRLGRADVVIVSAAESAMTPVGVGMFEVLKALTKSDDPDRFPKSLDELRDGFGYGETAGTVVLMNEEFARKHGLALRAELAGAAGTGDGFHKSDPHPEGVFAAHATINALQDAGGLEALAKEGKGYWSTHTTGTPGNTDKIEIRTLEYVTHSHHDALDGVSGTKPSTGHGLGGAAMQEFIFSVLALEEQTLPPMIKSEQLIAEAQNMPMVINEARPAHNVVWAGDGSHGFGGSNEVTIVTLPGVKKGRIAPVYATPIAP